MSAFTIYAETERVHELDFMFFGFGARISANRTGNFNYTCTYTTTCVVYNLVITEAIDGLSIETIMRLFYKHKTTDFYGTKPRATQKTTNNGTWNNIRKSVELPDLYQIIHAFS